MSLNNLKLQPAVLAQLYDKVLIEGKTSAQAASPAPDIKKVDQPPVTPHRPVVGDNTQAINQEVEIKTLGDNKKQVLVLCKNEGLAFLPDEELNQLTSILTACGLSLADIALANWHQAKEAGFDRVQETLRPRKVIAFGLTPQDLDLPVHFPDYQVQKIGNGEFVHAAPLSALMHDKGQKMLLWASLKKMFGL